MRSFLTATPYKALLCTLLVTVLFSCTKEEGEEDDDALQAHLVISGQVVLPAGSAVEVNSLRTQSVLEATAVKDGRFEVKTLEELPTTQLLTNGQGEVLMMAYHYEGQEDRTISAASTALALVMNSRAARFLSEEGQKQLVVKVKAAPEFGAVVRAVEESVKANAPLFDTTRSALQQSLRALFSSAALKMTGVQGQAAVDMYVAGKEVNFVNPGRAHSSVIGIYRDQVRVHKIVAEGMQIVPTSLAEVLNGYGTLHGNPVVHAYSFPADGEYQVKVRTGRPGADDGSTEHREAFYENLALFSFSLLNTFVPLVEGKGACNKKTITTTILNLLLAAQEVREAKTVAAAVYTAESVAFQSINEIVSHCNTVFNPNYFKSFTKYFNLIDKTFALVGNGANTSIFAYQWAASEPARDYCRTVKGSSVQVCYPITLTPLGIDKAGVKDYCYEGPLNVYYMSFGYEDPQGLIAANLSNLRMTYQMEVNGCIALFDTRTASDYFAAYPPRIADGKIWVPGGTSLGSNYSNWMKFYLQFERLDGTNYVPLSNKIEFTVTRGVNYHL